MQSFAELGRFVVVVVRGRFSKKDCTYHCWNFEYFPYLCWVDMSHTDSYWGELETGWQVDWGQGVPFSFNFYKKCCGQIKFLKMKVTFPFWPGLTNNLPMVDRKSSRQGGRLTEDRETGPLLRGGFVLQPTETHLPPTLPETSTNTQERRKKYKVKCKYEN